MEHLKQIIREVPDFPKPGILFYDITTLLKDAAGFKNVIDALQAHYRLTRVDLVLGVEARGFIFAPALAYALGAGFIPVRKPNKLPAKTVRETYQLEYGTDSLEIHEDLSLIHISEPTRLGMISYAVFCLKKKKKK